MPGWMGWVVRQNEKMLGRCRLSVLFRIAGRLMGFCLGALEDDCEEPTTSGKVSGKRLRNDHG